MIAAALGAGERRFDVALGNSGIIGHTVPDGLGITCLPCSVLAGGVVCKVGVDLPPLPCPEDSLAR